MCKTRRRWMRKSPGSLNIIVFTTTFHRFSTCPVLMQKFMMDSITFVIACCLAANFSTVSTSVGSWLPLAKSALYRPRCRPDGEVVVDSLHFRILPWNDSSVRLEGIASDDWVRRHRWSTWEHNSGTEASGTYICARQYFFGRYRVGAPQDIGSQRFLTEWSALCLAEVQVIAHLQVILNFLRRRDRSPGAKGE